MNPAIYWLIAGLILLIFDLFAGSFFLMWIAGGALLTALVALITPLAWVQWLAFFIFSIILLVASRPLARSIGRVSVPSNVDDLKGRIAVVLDEIDPLANTGRVRVGSDEWRARAEKTIAAGEQVVVEGVSGTTLLVKPIETGEQTPSATAQ